MTKGSFSSNDIFSVRFNQNLSDSNPALNYKDITIESILNTKKFLGSKTNVFRHNLYKDKLDLICNEAKKDGLFNINLYKFDIPDDLRNHICVFINKLSLWVQWCDHNNIDRYKEPNWYFIRSLSEGFSFGKKLKDVYDYSLRKSMSSYPFSIPEDVEECMDLVDLNQIYPPNHLMPWISDPDFSDVLDYSFSKNSINRSLLDKIKDKIYENIQEPEYLSCFNKGHMEHLLNNKKMYHSGKNAPSYIYKRTDNDDSGIDYLLFNIVSVTKTPCESRICAVADDNSRNLLYNSREMSKIIFKGKSRNFYGKKPWTAEKQLHEDGSTFIMYDQKKCGWTFPYEYLICAFDAAYKKTGHQNWKTLYDIYKNNRVFYDILGERYNPVRGFTLGMWDNLVSYIMECIFEVYLENCINEDQREFISAMFFGDDCVIKIKQSEKCYMTVTEIWAKFLSMLISAGIELNVKKSFFANFGIFCEMYGDNSQIFNHKVTNYLLNGLDVLTKYYTFERKICLNSWKEQMEAYTLYLPKNIQGIFLSYVKNIIIKVIRETQPEFSNEDHWFPLEIGGWFREVEDGLSIFLRRLQRKEFREERAKLIFTKSFEDYVSNYTNRQIIKDFDESFLLSNTLADIYREECLPNLLKKLTFFRNTSTLKKLIKFKEKYCKYRLDIYKSKPKTDILSYAYKKCCKNQHFPDDMFIEIDFFHAEFMRGLKQTPHKFPSGFNENLIGSIDMIDKYTYDTNGNEIRRHNIANIYRDIATSKYLIPTYWFKFCLSNRMSLDELYRRLDDVGLDLTRVQPKYSSSKDDYESTIYPLQNDFLYWDDITCSYYEISYEDCRFLLYKTNEQISEYLYNKYYGELGLEYWLFLEHMCNTRVKDPEIDYTSQDLELLEEWAAKQKNKEKNLASSDQIQRTMYESIQHIQEDLGYESDQSDQKKEGDGYYRGVYIKYIDPNHEDFDYMLKTYLERGFPIDPIEYQDEIREYPIIGTFEQDANSDYESVDGEYFNEDEDPD
jgi:hypothetical protein